MNVFGVKMSNLFKSIALLFVVMSLAGWKYPESGKDYSNDVTSATYNYMKNNVCKNGVVADCIGVSDELSPGIIMYVYDMGNGETKALLNPHFISSYALSLHADCEEGKWPEACSKRDEYLQYLEDAKQSPKTGLDIWYVYSDEKTGKANADAMVQSQISLLYYRVGNCGQGYSSIYCERMERAGAAFDWGYANHGVADIVSSDKYWYVSAGANEPERRDSLNVMNKALLNLHDIMKGLPEDKKPIWKWRIDRGINLLKAKLVEFDCPSCKDFGWSYVRTWEVKNVADVCYHKLNWSTLERLVGRGYDSDGTLYEMFNKWKLQGESQVEQCEN